MAQRRTFVAVVPKRQDAIELGRDGNRTVYHRRGNSAWTHHPAAPCPERVCLNRHSR